VQKLETDLEDLRTLIRDQTEAMNVLRQTLADKDAAIAALKAGEKPGCARSLSE
jgi:peptidoglycan hydrolase CwlO-like protein